MTTAVEQPLRVTVGEDDLLLRQGVVRVLHEAGMLVVAEAGDAEELLGLTLAYEPDVAVIDIRMPPHRGDDGLRVAVELRNRLPTAGVVVLTQFDDPQYALELIGDRVDGVGYLLKERVGDVNDFCAAVVRVARGGSAIDPAVVMHMMRPHRVSDELALLSDRELAVLASMAEGLSNVGISRALFISVAAVEKHVTAIFRKLGVTSDPTGHRRVQAVLQFLTSRKTEARGHRL